MNVEIRSRGKALPSALKSHADQRLRCALSRFSNRIRTVKVVVDWPADALTHCEVSVRLDSGEELRVEDESPDVRLILDHAALRVGRLVGRSLRRPEGTSAKHP